MFTLDVGLLEGVDEVHQPFQAHFDSLSIQNLQSSTDLSLFLEPGDLRRVKVLIFTNASWVDLGSEVSRIEDLVQLGQLTLILAVTTGEPPTPGTSALIDSVGGLTYSSLEELDNLLTLLRDGLEERWVRRRIVTLLELYDEVSDAYEDDHAIDHFLAEIQDLFRMQIVELYRYNDIRSEYQVQHHTGPSSPHKSYERSIIEAGLRFGNALEVIVPSDTVLLKKVHSQADWPFRNDPEPVFATFRYQGDNCFIVYYPTDLRDTPDDVWLVASREIMHLYRSVRRRRIYQCLAELTKIGDLHRGKREPLWNALVLLKSYFQADGASLVELVGRDGENYLFDKTYIHHSREDHVRFSTNHGFAVEALNQSRALIVGELTNSMGRTFIYDLDSLRSGTYEVATIRTFDAPRTVETEKSILYFPLNCGREPAGVVKIASFSESYAFDLQDLRALALFVEPLGNILSNVRAAEMLRQDAERLRLFEMFEDQASRLLFYREITAGYLHQISNHLNHLQSELLLAQSLSSLIPDENRRAITTHLEESNHYVKNSKELIGRAQKRGKTLNLMQDKCMLVRDVVRPALEYLDRVIRFDPIHISHSLTNLDYPVDIDRELGIESVINILNNAVWAVRHARRGRKEIFVAVRCDKDENEVRILVRDTGVGIAPSVLPRLFEPFFTTREADGTGLGLYFARRLFEGFGGSVRIARSSLDRGTIVVMTIPLTGEPR